MNRASPRQGRLRVAFLAAPLLLLLPATPAHENQIQWDVACATTQPTSATLTTVGSRALSYTPAELALTGDRLLVSRWSDGGFEVFSLADPTNPTLLGSIATGGTTLDAKASADGKTVFVGTVGAVHVVDISDPTNPVRIRTVGLPIFEDQGHMLHVATIAGQEHLFVATQSGSGVYVYRVTGTPASRNLQRLAQFAPGSPLGAHDTFVQHDPVLGKPILYVANGFAGWLAADVTNPASPALQAVVPNPDAGQGYLHTVQSSWVNGRRLVATIEELGANVLRVWDATTLTAPLLVAEWSSQTTIGFVPSVSSQHNLQIVDGRLYVAHYRCGFYVFDLRTLPALPVPAALTPIAHYAPQHPDGQHWDLVLRNGYLYTSDMRMESAGVVYAVRYAGIPAGDPAQTSTG